MKRNKYYMAIVLFKKKNSNNMILWDNNITLVAQLYVKEVPSISFFKTIINQIPLSFIIIYKNK